MRRKTEKESGISRRQVLKGALLAGTGAVVVGTTGLELKPGAPTKPQQAAGKDGGRYEVTRHVLDYYHTLAQ